MCICTPLSDIAAVDDCQQRTQLENFPDTPRNETLTSLEFITPANPNEAFVEGGIQLESVTVGDLQEYQSYVFTVTVRNSLGEGTPMTVCSRTEEAGMYYSTVGRSSHLATG